MRKTNFIKISYVLLFSTVLAVSSTSVLAKDANKVEPVSFETNLTIQERMLHRRAVEAAVWGMPLANYHAMREGHRKDLGMEMNDIVIGSNIQDWRMRITTPNNTTPYVMAFWNLKNGPIVVEIPKSTEHVGLYGAMLDSWQRPLEDMGQRGKDGGAGAKYVVLPPNYQGSYPRGRGYVVVKSQTYGNYMLLRPLIKSTSKENLKLATEFAKKVKIYPLAQKNNPKANRYFDSYGKHLNLVPSFDHTYFQRLNDLIQEEPIERKDLAILGQLKALGIEKGMSFNPDARLRKILDSAAQEAHDYMNDVFVNGDYNRSFFKHWRSLAPYTSIETAFVFEYPTHLDIDGRGSVFNQVFGPVKNFDTFSPNAFYLTTAKDADGDLLSGSNNYRLTVPANVPVSQFWSALAYEMKDATWLDHQPKPGVASIEEGVIVNKDGSVDLYLGPKSPKGKEANWIPTTKGEDYYLIFRVYGVKKEFFLKKWVLGGIQKVK